MWGIIAALLLDADRIAVALIMCGAVIAFSPWPGVYPETGAKVCKGKGKGGKHSAADKALLKADRLTGPQFEQWCAKLLRRNGFWLVRVVGKSNDQGADIIAWKHFRKYVIQCKCYGGKVGNAAVQQVNAAVEYYGWQWRDRAVVMTNSYFTKGGIQAAGKCNVLLWDRDTLRNMWR